MKSFNDFHNLFTHFHTHTCLWVSVFVTFTVLAACTAWAIAVVGELMIRRWLGGIGVRVLVRERVEQRPRCCPW